MMMRMMKLFRLLLLSSWNVTVIRTILIVPRNIYLLRLLLIVVGVVLLSGPSHGLTIEAGSSSTQLLDRRRMVSIVGSSLSGVLSLPTSSGAVEVLPSSSPPVTSSSSSSPTKDTITLSNGTPFPLVSFGLQIYNDETAYTLTRMALDVGYKNFFASVLAGNQKGFAKAIKDSGIPRETLFICGSVVSNRVSGYNDAKKLTTIGWKKNMDCFALGDITYLDQIMLDYPGPDCPSIQGQWSAFEEMYQQGLTKTLSVSNFSPTQLDCVLQQATVKPVVNQLPYSVAYHPGESVMENQKRGILVQAWAPLGGSLGGRFSSTMKGVCNEIGKRYGKTYAQVALRWIIQTGASFTTQTKNKQHFQEDLNIFDFELTPEEMVTLSKLA